MIFHFQELLCSWRLYNCLKYSRPFLEIEKYADLSTLAY